MFLKYNVFGFFNQQAVIKILVKIICDNYGESFDFLCQLNKKLKTLV